MNTIARSVSSGAGQPDTGQRPVSHGAIPGRPVLDPMNHLSVDEELRAERGTENPYFGESDPGRLPHLERTMHIRKTRRWVFVSGVLWVATMALGIALIPLGAGLAAGTLALALALFGLTWIFRMYLESDARRTLVLVGVVVLQALLAFAMILMLVAG